LNPPAWISQPLEDVGVTAQVGTAHAPGVIEMRERAFDQFAAPLAAARSKSGNESKSLRT